jgi:hypothetical protein
MPARKRHLLPRRNKRPATAIREWPLAESDGCVWGSMLPTGLVSEQKHLAQIEQEAQSFVSAALARGVDRVRTISKANGR